MPLKYNTLSNLNNFFVLTFVIFYATFQQGTKEVTSSYCGMGEKLNLINLYNNYKLKRNIYCYNQEYSQNNSNRMTTPKPTKFCQQNGVTAPHYTCGAMVLC